MYTPLDDGRASDVAAGDRGQVNGQRSSTTPKSPIEICSRYIDINGSLRLSAAVRTARLSHRRIAASTYAARFPAAAGLAGNQKSGKPSGKTCTAPTRLNDKSLYGVNQERTRDSQCRRTCERSVFM